MKRTPIALRRVTVQEPAANGVGHDGSVDGSQEDVTCLARFRTNNDQVADIDENGLVASSKSGDTHVVAFYDNGVVPVPVMQPVSTKKYPKVPTPTKVDELIVRESIR